MLALYKEVPKDFIANLEWRVALRKKAAKDYKFRAAVRVACREDVLFFMNSMCWLYEPRPQRFADGSKKPNIIPFITWEHQDPAILRIKEFLGEKDIGVEKSRGEGASWIAVALGLHDWLFDPMSAIGFVSRSMDAADKTDDPDSLMWKVDHMLAHLPKWMRPRFSRSKTNHTLINIDYGSSITAYAAVGDVASGGRKKWFLSDELAKFPRGPDEESMASTQYVTNSRLVISTPKGNTGAYYDLMHRDSTLVRIELDWKQNPTRNRGLYSFQNNKPVAVDPINNPLPENYNPPSQEILNLFSILRKNGFKLDGVLRSPWYDQECARPGATPQNVAQELDRDYGGSMFRIFGHEVLGNAEASARVPMSQGVMSYSPDKIEPHFDSVDEGEIKLWTPLDFQGAPPSRPYIIGCDVSNGLGGSFTSNSVACVLDLITMEQVAELSSNTIEPGDFADTCIALAKWFHNAHLAWEANGPGSAFTKRVIDRGYSDIYKRRVLYKRSKSRRGNDLGWWTDTKNKEMMFSELGLKIRTGDLTIRSKSCAKELGDYVRINGKIEHVISSKGADDASRGESHGDRVIALGVAVMASKERSRPSSIQKNVTETTKIIPGTMSERQRDWEESQEKEKEEWDDRTNGDLAFPRRGAGAILGLSQDL
jgi:hypothetical protein